MDAVLFLDVDGVLNHRAVFDGRRPPLCLKAIARLRRIVDEAGCKVVLSSTWRKMQGHVDELKAAGGFPSPHEDWRTIEQDFVVENGLIKSVAMRGNEIAEWLSRHPEVKRYAIVDDDSDILPEQKERFVQTTFDAGMLDEHADRLIRMLRS